MRKILSLEDIINKPYSKVTIELNEDCDIKEVKNILKKEGQTQISLLLNSKNKKILYNLQNARKFDYHKLKIMKNKEYVKKISV